MTMHSIFAPAGKSEAVPILFVTAASFDQAIEKVDDRERAFVQAAGFEPKAGRHLLVPAADGRLAGVLFGLEDADEPAKDLFRPGALAGLLPAGVYRFANAPHDTRLATLAFALNAYQFTRYRKAEPRDVRMFTIGGGTAQVLRTLVAGRMLGWRLPQTRDGYLDDPRRLAAE